MHHSSGQGGRINSEPQRDDSSRLLIGMINFILTALGRTGSYPSRVISVARLLAEESDLKPKRAKRDVYLMLSFSEEDKVGTIQPYDDTLSHS